MTKKKEKPQEVVSVDEEAEAQDAEMAELRAAKQADMVLE